MGASAYKEEGELWCFYLRRRFRYSIGTGGGVRNSNGFVLTTKSVFKESVASFLLAELVAIAEGVAVAVNLGASKIPLNKKSNYQK